MMDAINLNITSLLYKRDMGAIWVMDWGYSSVVECLPSMHEASGSLPNNPLSLN